MILPVHVGMQIIRAIVSGERDPKVLAKYRNNNCKREEAEIAKALDGNYRPELIFALKQSLEGYDFFQDQIVACDYKINQMITNWQAINNGPIVATVEPSSNLSIRNSEQKKLASELQEILKVDLD